MQQALSNASVLCQSWGYNGMKRMHRYFMCKFNHLEILLKNEMFDNHELIAPLTHDPYPAYSPASIKDHAQKWYSTLCDATKQVAMANVELVKLTGYQSCIVKCMLKYLYKQKEKARRFLKRGEEVQWMAHDLHVYDDCLHEKYKKKEKKHDV